MTEQDYPWVRRWHQFLGSYQYYIDGQVALARKDKAPQTATHRNQDGSWSTIDDIVRESARRQLGLPPLNTPEVE